MVGRRGADGSPGVAWPPPNGKLLTVGEAARLLNAHPNSVRRWSDMGLLSCYRIGYRGDRRFTRESISRFIGSSEAGYGP